MNPVLETKKLTHTYGIGTPFRSDAITDIDLAVYPGEFVGIIGHTGSGKSTMIQHLNGLPVKATSAVTLMPNHRTIVQQVAVGLLGHLAG